MLTYLSDEIKNEIEKYTISIDMGVLDFIAEAIREKLNKVIDEKEDEGKKIADGAFSTETSRISYCETILAILIKAAGDYLQDPSKLNQHVLRGCLKQSGRYLRQAKAFSYLRKPKCQTPSEASPY